MIEHEVKVLNIDAQLVMKQLEKLWAEHYHTVFIKDWYYDTKDDSLRKQNQRLRIRCEDNTIVITKKTKYEHDYTKSMKEDDITVKSVKYAKKLLEEELWLVCKKYKEKKRVTYKRKNALFDFDYYEDMPPILEIEGESPEHVMDIVRRLGLHFHPQVKRWSRRLFKHYGKKHL